MQLDYKLLEEDAAEVLRTLNSKVFEIPGPQDTWFQARIMPYKTLDNLIDGLVITFSDITGLKRTENRERRARTLAESIVDIIAEPILVLDGADLRVESANRAYYHLFKTLPGNTVGRKLTQLGRGQWNLPALIAALERMVGGEAEVKDFSVDGEFAGVGRREFLVNARMIPDEEGHQILLALSAHGEPPPLDLANAQSISPGRKNI